MSDKNKNKDKNNDKNKKMSFREAARLNIRAYKLIYKNYPQMMLSRLVDSVWGALTPYIGIYLSARLIDELAGSRDPERIKTLVLAILLSSAVIALGGAFINKWRQTKGCYIYYKIERIFSNKLLSMDFVDIDDPNMHALRSTIRQNNDGGGWGIHRITWQFDSIFSQVFSIGGGIAMTVSLFMMRVPESSGSYTVLNNPLFILLIVAVMLAVTYISPALSTKAESYRSRNMSNHTLGNRLFGFFGWMGSNKILDGDVRIYRQDLICDKHNTDKTGIFCSKGFFAKLERGPVGLYNAASAAVSVIFSGVVYAFVCAKALGGAFGVGMVTQYVGAVSRVSGGVSGLFSTIGGMRNNAPFLKLIFDFLDIPNNMYQGSLTVEKRRDRDYEVEFKNVSFKYPGSDNYALKNVSMKFKIGSRLAIVGMNGSGKTTFIKLLCRLYDPTEGEILLNGIDIRKYNYDDYMGVFSVVFQDFKLLEFKLGENVASSNNVDRELAAECLKMAGFGERLATLEQGLDTYLYKDFVDEGLNISGGEAQKIAIARALYKNAPFIVLDEPTAALDPLAEAEIYTKFNEIAGDKTAIYISHRLSSCKFCDDIAVFHEGSVIQYGTHASLLADSGGKYAELWNAQAQYYTEKE